MHIRQSVMSLIQHGSVGYFGLIIYFVTGPLSGYRQQRIQSDGLPPDLYFRDIKKGDNYKSSDALTVSLTIHICALLFHVMFVC